MNQGKTRLAGQSNTIVLEEKFKFQTPRVHVSERQGTTLGRFNTLQDPVTRELTITGVSLHWDGSDVALEALRTTRDVTRIVLIADEITIEQELQWKGASVDIYARRLKFHGEGSIVTTPESYAGPAFSRHRSSTDDGGDHPLNANGEIEAADGLDGEPGGDVRLFVAELDVDDGKTLRVVTDGQPGQIGEKGGALPFEPRQNGPKTRDVRVVSKDDVLAVFGNASNSTNQLKDIKHWKTVGGEGAEGFDKTWTRITGNDIRNGVLIDYSAYEVVDVRVGLAFQKVLQALYNEVPVPSRERSSGLRKVPGQTTFEKAWEETLKLSKPWTPSKGADAYPSGYTGRGGHGGAITLPAAADDDTGWYSNRGGASELSPEVPGGPAGTPGKYIVAAFSAAQVVNAGVGKAVLNLPEKVHMHRITGTTEPGKTEKGRAKGTGDAGEVTRADARAWLEPRLLRTMADHAGALYASGRREHAWEVIAPYWREWQQGRQLTQAALPTDARAAVQAIGNLVQNYQANLDLYGNPPGWVPRFSASNYLRTYLADRRFSYRFIGAMEQAITLMDDVEHANAMLGELAKRTEDVIDQLRTEMFNAFKRYHDARDTFEKAHSALRSKQQKLAALESDAELAAAIQVKDQAIMKAVFDISGAVLKAIPAYQPALAGLGTVVEGVGSVVVDNMNRDPDEPFDGWKAVAAISGSVEDMLKENAGSFKSQLEGDLRKKYKDQLHPEAVDLKNQVNKLRVDLAGAETKQAQAADAALKRLNNDPRLADLLRTDPEETKRIADRLLGENAKNREDLMKQLKELNVSIKELDSVREEGRGGEITDAAQRRLVLAREKLNLTLKHVALERRRLERRIAEDEKNRAEAIKELEAFETRTSDLTATRDTFDKLFKKGQKTEAEDKIKQAGETASKVLDGAQRMAHGAATIATTIGSVAEEPKADSDEVQAVKARILKSKYGEQYAELLEQVDRATEQMSEALGTLMSCNQGVTTLTADFAGAIQSSIDIGRNRIAFARGLDAGLKTSLVSMQRQARERMDYYLYLFRKAYMYEECATVKPGVASLNIFIKDLVERLRDSSDAIKGSKEGDSGSAELRGLSQLSVMSDKNIEEIGNDAMRHILGELANDLMRRRQQKGLGRGNTLRVELGEQQCRTLTSEGRVELGRVLDLIPNSGDRKRFRTQYPLLKLAGIAIANGDLRFRATSAPRQTLTIVFEFGRELKLWDGDQYVMFRIGRAEEPLTMAFSATHFTKLENDEWSCAFKADASGAVDDVFTTVSKEALGELVNYREISPSFLSTLSVSITMGVGQVEEITQLFLNLDWNSR